MNEPIYLGVLQSDLDCAGFDLLNFSGSGGSGGSELETGVMPLIVGQSYIDVVFDTAQPNVNWTLTGLSIVNTVDAITFNLLPGVITTKSVTGFRLQLTGQPDTGNYKLEWAILPAVAISGAATTYRFIGPSSGAVDAPSTFIVSLPLGTGASVPVTVTPSDGGGGGSFLPSTVILTTAAWYAGFTYTPASIGSKTLSVTNSGGLINPDTRSFEAVPAEVEITPTTGEVPLNVVLTSPDGLNIIYTLDNIAPTLDYGTEVTSPATISVLAPCAVRAVATDGTRISPQSVAEYVYTGRTGDPTAIAGLKAWHRSDSVVASGGFVTTWTDLSGSGSDATPVDAGYVPSGGVGPLVVAGALNGQPVLRFNGTSSFLEGGCHFNQPNLFFFVAKQTSRATLGTFLVAMGDSYIRIGCDTSGHYFMDSTYAGGGSSSPFTITDTSTDRHGAFHNFESRWNGASSAAWVDGEEVFTVDTAANSVAVQAFGADLHIGTYFTGDIVEIIRYAETNVSESDRLWLEAYLGNRYALPNAVPFAPGPSNLPGLAVWLKADALALADGAEIATWADSSGNGKTATKGTVGPIFKTNILNGKPVARFTAADWLNLPDLSQAQPYTVIFVSKGSATGYTIGGGSMAIVNMPSGFSIYAGVSIADGVDHTGAFHVFSVEFNGASSKAYIDGGLALSGNIGGGGIGLSAIGASNQAGVDTTFAGDFAELIIYRRLLTADEREEIEAYLRIKYATP